MPETFAMRRPQLITLPFGYNLALIKMFLYQKQGGNHGKDK